MSIGEQLPMFIDPAEIINNTVSGKWMSIDDIDNDTEWRYKLNKARQGGHRGSDLANVRNWRVFTPVTLMVRQGQVTMGNGHHRVAISADLGMPLIPITWDDKDWFGNYPSKDGEWGVEQFESEMITRFDF